MRSNCCISTPSEGPTSRTRQAEQTLTCVPWMGRSASASPSAVTVVRPTGLVTVAHMTLCVTLDRLHCGGMARSFSGLVRMRQAQ